MTLPEHIVEEAIRWHVRLADDAADWDGFLLWLEADPVHARAYEEVASADRAVDVHQAHLPANDHVDVGTDAARRWTPWAIAAVALLSLGLGTQFWIADRNPSQIYETGAAIRQIALADGAQIILDRNSAISVNRGSVNNVVLQKGGAYFVAPTDPDPSFDVQVGGYHVRDIGTRFFVGRATDLVQVQVADGSIVLSAAAQSPVRLHKGQAIELAEKSNRARLYNVQPAHVARWQAGQLAYDEVPLSVVIADLQRASGLTLTLDPSMADERFTGVLMIGDGTRLVSDFSDLTGFVAERRGETIFLRPAR